jgi:phytoene synthase
VEALESWIATDLVESREAAILDDLCRRHPLPRASLAAFAQGMRDDLAGPDIVTEDDLDVYCSRVAGAVGEMMAAILGVRDDRAWGAACALGCAMQRTNILRDVDEDMVNGRVYLARDTLDRFGITDLASQDRTALYRDQIARADALFDEGLAGVPMLLNGDRAIAAAAVMYREILREIERGGYGAARDRAVVSGRRKAWLMGVALMRPAHWS